MKRALYIAENLKADLGGTEMFIPIMRLLQEPVTKGYIRQIYLITDGEINNIDEILNFVYDYRSNTRIFTVGIGNYRDSGIIERISRMTHGSSIYVSSDADDLEEKVIDLLESSLSLPITDAEIYKPIISYQLTYKFGFEHMIRISLCSRLSEAETYWHQNSFYNVNKSSDYKIIMTRFQIWIYKKSN